MVHFMLARSCFSVGNQTSKLLSFFIESVWFWCDVFLRHIKQRCNIILLWYIYGLHGCVVELCRFRVHFCDVHYSALGCLIVITHTLRSCSDWMPPHNSFRVKTWLSPLTAVFFEIQFSWASNTYCLARLKSSKLAEMLHYQDGMTHFMLAVSWLGIGKQTFQSYFDFGFKVPDFDVMFA